MTNPMFNPQPNYSGVTIQIANPAVNVGDCTRNSAYGNNLPNVGIVQPSVGLNGIPNKQIYGYQTDNFPQNNYVSYPQDSYALNTDKGSFDRAAQGITSSDINNSFPNNFEQQSMANPVKGYPNAYPAQYYLNNYNYGPNGTDNKMNIPGNNENLFNNKLNDNNHAYEYNNNNYKSDINSYKDFADKETPYDTDLSRSENIIDGIDERAAEERKEKKNTKEKKIVALTDEYIKSLENYLNNPNDEIRLMASKEVLKRLDEDKNRYNDAALNALLNKMMQDPSKLVRLASLSAFASQLASGNDYTVKLLHDIQSNPNADKEDVLQAADILLKMSAGVEVKNVPILDKNNKDSK